MEPKEPFYRPPEVSPLAPTTFKPTTRTCHKQKQLKNLITPKLDDFYSNDGEQTSRTVKLPAITPKVSQSIEAYSAIPMMHYTCDVTSAAGDAEPAPAKRRLLPRLVHTSFKDDLLPEYDIRPVRPHAAFLSVSVSGPLLFPACP